LPAREAMSTCVWIVPPISDAKKNERDEMKMQTGRVGAYARSWQRAWESFHVPRHDCVWEFSGADSDDVGALGSCTRRWRFR
jgi:hypothetical protein